MNKGKKVKNTYFLYFFIHSQKGDDKPLTFLKKWSCYDNDTIKKKVWKWIILID